jgi:predicted exporter
MTYCLDRVPALAAKKPALKNVEPFKTVLSGNREAIAKLPMRDLEKIIISTLTGMTTEEFEAEVKEWLARDPLPAYRAVLTGRGVDAAALDEIEKNAREAVDRATEEAKAGPLPRLELAGTNVWADGGNAWRN